MIYLHLHQSPMWTPSRNHILFAVTQHLLLTWKSEQNERHSLELQHWLIAFIIHCKTNERLTKIHEKIKKFSYSNFNIPCSHVESSFQVKVFYKSWVNLAPVFLQGCVSVTRYIDFAHLCLYTLSKENTFKEKHENGKFKFLDRFGGVHFLGKNL